MLFVLYIPPMEKPPLPCGRFAAVPRAFLMPFAHENDKAYVFVVVFTTERYMNRKARHRFGDVKSEIFRGESVLRRIE
jgi:hypothetical protein